MKTPFFILCFFVTSIVYSQKRIPSSRLNDVTIDRLTVFKNKKPVTGIVFWNYPDGTLKQETSFLNGVWHGKSKWYSSDGELSAEGDFHDGKKVGTHWTMLDPKKDWYRTEIYTSKGVLLSRKTVQYGKTTKYYELDKGESRFTYEDGMLKTATRDNSKRQLVSITTYENGTISNIKEYCANKMLLKEISYKDNYQKGWDCSGNLIYEQTNDPLFKSDCTCKIFSGFPSNVEYYKGPCIDGKAYGWGTLHLKNGDNVSYTFLNNKVQNACMEYSFKKTGNKLIGPNIGWAKHGVFVKSGINTSSYVSYDNDKYMGGGNPSMYFGNFKKNLPAKIDQALQSAGISEDNLTPCKSLVSQTTHDYFIKTELLDNEYKLISKIDMPDGSYLKTYNKLAYEKGLFSGMFPELNNDKCNENKCGAIIIKYSKNNEILNKIELPNSAIYDIAVDHINKRVAVNYQTNGEKCILKYLDYHELSNISYSIIENIDQLGKLSFSDNGYFLLSNTSEYNTDIYVGSTKYYSVPGRPITFNEEDNILVTSKNDDIYITDLYKRLLIGHLRTGWSINSFYLDNNEFSIITSYTEKDEVSITSNGIKRIIQFELPNPMVNIENFARSMEYDSSYAIKLEKSRQESMAYYSDRFGSQELLKDKDLVHYGEEDDEYDDLSQTDVTSIKKKKKINPLAYLLLALIIEERLGGSRKTYSQPSSTSNSSEKRKCHRCDGTGKCRKCGKPQKVTFKGKHGSESQNEVRYGFIVCSSCYGDGISNSYPTVGDPCKLCNNGWVKCEECSNRNPGACRRCEGKGHED